MLGQHELQPGQATELKIVYNTYKFPGKFEKFVYIELEGEKGEPETITLRGEVEPIPMGVLEVNPRKLDAGKMGLNQPARLELEIRNVGDADLRVRSIVSQKQEKQHYNAEKDGELIITPGAAKSLPLTVEARQKGRFMDYIMIHADGGVVSGVGYKVVVVGQCE